PGGLPELPLDRQMGAARPVHGEPMDARGDRRRGSGTGVRGRLVSLFDFTKAVVLVFDAGTKQIPVTKAGILVFDAGTKQIQVTKAGILVFDTLRPPPPPPADCTVELTVYEDDGETIAWQVSTDPAHETPYLVEPTNYGSQEVDFGEGRASIG